MPNVMFTLAFVGGEGLVLTRTDEPPIPSLAARRAFPVSDPSRWISIVKRGGEEVEMIEDPVMLDATSQRAIQKALEREYLWPKILRIRSLKEYQGISDWEVDTDHGPARFQVQGMNSAAVEVAPNRYLITDMTGGRYEIPDLLALDPKSQNLIRRWV